MATPKKAAVNKAAKKSTSPKKAATAKPPVQKKRAGIKQASAKKETKRTSTRNQNDTMKLRSEHVVAVAKVDDTINVTQLKSLCPSIAIWDGMTVFELANNLGVKEAVVITALASMGMSATPTQALETKDILNVAISFGYNMFPHRRISVRPVSTLLATHAEANANVGDDAQSSITLSTKSITIRSLAKDLGILPGTLISTLFRNGIIALVDEPLSFEAAQLAAKLSGFTICQTSQKPAGAADAFRPVVGESLRTALQEARQRPFLKLDLPDFTPDKNRKVGISGYFIDPRGVRRDIRHIPSGLDYLKILSSDDPDAALQEHYAKCEAESAVEKTPAENAVEAATQRIKDLALLDKQSLAVITSIDARLAPILSSRQASSEWALRVALGLPPYPGTYGSTANGGVLQPQSDQDDCSFLHELAAELINLGEAIAREAIIRDV